jgi:hypothetical protein
MPQVMKSETVEARADAEFVPAAVDVAWLNRCADGGGEYEPVLCVLLPGWGWRLIEGQPGLNMRRTGLARTPGSDSDRSY